MPTNPDTGSEIEYEEDGDFTITIPMRLPSTPDTDEK
jgi:hypothetical protein